jgi:hypothetical protein
VVGDKENDESIFRLENPHPIKDNSIFEASRIVYNEKWFQSIDGQEIESYFGHIWLSFSLAQFRHAPDSLVLALICSPVVEFIPQII